MGQTKSYFAAKTLGELSDMKHAGLLPHSRLTVEEQEAVIMEEYRLSITTINIITIAMTIITFTITIATFINTITIIIVVVVVINKPIVSYDS